MKKTLELVKDWISEDLEKKRVPGFNNAIASVYARIFWVINTHNKYTHKVSDEEVEAIIDYRKSYNFSIAELSFIFNRSKSTIHKFVKDTQMVEYQELITESY